MWGRNLHRINFFGRIFSIFLRKLSIAGIILFIIGFLLFCFNTTAHAEVVYEFQRAWGSPGTGNGQFGWNIRSIEVDITPGNVYVSDSDNDRIEIFDPDGNFLTSFGSTGSGYWEFNGLDGIALDGSYNIYAADSGNCRIQKFSKLSPSGIQHLGEWISHENCIGPPGSYNNPLDTAVDWRAKVYVTSAYYACDISKFEDNGDFMMRYYAQGNCCAYRVAIDRDGDVYVVCHDGTIQRFDSNGNFVRSWGADSDDIAVDRQKNVYVTAGSRIQKFDSEGNFVTQWYPLAVSGGGVAMLMGIAVDVSGNVYVADMYNHRIEKYSPLELSELDHIELSPSSSAITAGGSQTYTAMAYDSSNDSLVNVTNSTTFSITPDGSCAGSTCTAAVAGPHTVTGSYSDETATASLQVNPSPAEITLDLLPPEYLDCGNVSINGYVGTSDGTITRLSWDWGDGVVADSWFPASHHYGANGSYTVTVTAYCSTSDKQSTSTTVDISNAEYPLCEDIMPPIGSISINSDAAYTNSFSVTLNLSCDDGTGSGCAEMQFSNDNVTYSPPEAFAATKSWTLTCGNGTKEVYAKFKDNIGNWSGVYSDTINYNGDLSMSIDSGASYTNSQDVMLTTNVLNCASYTCIGRSVKNDDDSFSTGFTCNSPAQWYLSAGVGEKTVYMTESYMCYEANPVCGRFCCGMGPFGCYRWCNSSCPVVHKRDMCDTIQLNTAPTAQAGGPYTTYLGTGISFDGSNSSDPDAGDSIVSYSWGIADGTYILSGPTPSLTAEQVNSLGAGTHSVQLTVTDSFGATGTETTTLAVAIDDNRPFAVFTANPNPAGCNEAIIFDASGSYHSQPDRSIVSYEWDFDTDCLSFSPDASGIHVSHTFLVFGDHQVGLRVTDDNVPAKSDISCMTVTVNFYNVPPLALAGGPYTAYLGSGMTLDGSGSTDPNTPCDSIASFSWDIASGAYTLTGPTPSLTAEQVNSLGAGTHSVQLTVTDTLGATDSAATTLNISSPVITLDLFSPEYSACGNVSINGYVGTSEGTITRLSWDWGDGVVVDSWFLAYHRYETNGSYTVTVTAFSSSGDTQSNSITVDITNVEDPLCSISLITPEYLYCGNVSVTGCVGKGICINCSVERFSWDWGDGTVADSWWPASHHYQANGTYTLTVTAHCSTGETESSFTMVNITNAEDPLCNQPPVANAGPDQNVVTQTLVNLDGSSSYDPDGDMITFLWSFIDVPAGSTVSDASLSNVNDAKPTFIPDIDGNYRLSLIVNDGVKDSTPDEVMIIASTLNVAPNADAGPDQNAFTGNIVYLDGSASSDPDNGPSPLSYLWSFFAIPNGSLLINNDISGREQANAAFTTDVDGTYEITLTVSDGDLESSDNVVIVSTTPNVAPNANAGADITIYLGETATLDGSASNDPDDGPQPMTYLWSFVAIPTGSNLNNNAILSRDTVSPSFTPDITGTFVLELMVSDGQDYAYDNVAISVIPVPQKPDLEGAWSYVTNIGPSKKNIYKVSGTFTISNTGTAKANNVVVNVYFSIDNIFDPSDTLIKTSKYSNIKTGSNKTMSISFSSSTYPGGKYLIGVIDPNNTVDELNEGNNVDIAIIP